MMNGTMEVRRPRVRNTTDRFESQILPHFRRKSKQLDELLPKLYLHGLATGDFEQAMRGLLGAGAPLSRASIQRLKSTWQLEYDEWVQQDLSGLEVVYQWADGLYVKAGIAKERAALLVIIGALSDGRKVVLACESGQRESKESWSRILRNLQRRGLKLGRLTVADGHLGIWSALGEQHPEGQEQRCWNHKSINVADHLPKTSVVAWIIPKDALSWCFSTQGITWMPHKFNAARRHKFDKAQYRVINWAEYNESLRQRGDLTIWVSDEAQSVWSAPRRTSRGGQRRYSDLAIETCLTLRTAYRLGLRQTQGLMGSIGTLMGLDIRVPDYSTLSRRANGLSIAQAVRQAGSVPVHLVVDSTGLKIFGEGEWLAQKHKTRGIRRRWRKLHLGLDLASGAIVCANLSHDDVGDSTALPGLLDQLDAPVTGFLADGAYDGASTRDMLRHRYGETLDVVIPPPKNAVIRPQSARDPTVRDRHIAQIRSNGRMAWQVATGYNQRSRIETQIGRWKGVIGPKLKSRSFSRQITEIKVGQKVLNTMTALGRPVFERIA